MSLTLTAALLVASATLLLAPSANPLQSDHHGDGASTTRLIDAAQCDFALGLLREALASDATDLLPQSSVVISPSTVTHSLAVLYGGSANSTRAELRRALAGPRGWTLSAADIQRNLFSASDAVAEGADALLESALRHDDAFYRLRTVPKVWMDVEVAVSDAYRRFITDNRHGWRVGAVDFARQPDAAVHAINDFAANRTGGEIHRLLTAGDIRPQYTRLVVANAASFRGRWLKAFHPKLTEKQAFYVTKRLTQNVPMMRKTSRFNYYENDRLQLVGLPYMDTYESGRLTLYLVLPKERYALHSTLEALDSARFNALLDRVRSEIVMLQLPKFRVESRHDLSALLRRVGIQKVFSPELANLTGIAADAKPPLYVDVAVERDLFEVDERGVEAAASTEIVGGHLQSHVSASRIHRYYSVTANHPFIFLLVAAERRRVLFAGAVNRVH